MSEVNSCSVVLNTCHAETSTHMHSAKVRPTKGIIGLPTYTRGLSLRLCENQVKCFRGPRVGLGEIYCYVILLFTLAIDTLHSAVFGMQSCGVCLSVRPSVCHTPVLCLNGQTYIKIF